MTYSGFRLIREALTGHGGWKPVWRTPEPQSSYDFGIVGGGGHGLATAHYLAKVYKKSRIAVLGKGWIGGGNVGRKGTPATSHSASSAKAADESLSGAAAVAKGTPRVAGEGSGGSKNVTAAAAASGGRHRRRNQKKRDSGDATALHAAEVETRRQEKERDGPARDAAHH